MRKHKMRYESPDLGSRYLKEGILNFKRLVGFCFLFGGLALLPDFIWGEPRIWVIVSVACIIVLATLNHLIFIFRTKSMHSLILFMEVTYLCMSMLLLLMSFNSLWYQNTFKILVEYKHWVALLVFLSVLYGIYWGLKYWPRNIKNTMNFIRNSEISSGELYYSFFKLPNIDAIAQGRFNNFIGIGSILGIVSAQTLGGYGYTMLLVVIIFLMAFPSVLTSLLVRRIFFQKYLGRWDIKIHDL